MVSGSGAALLTESALTCRVTGRGRLKGLPHVGPVVCPTPWGGKLAEIQYHGLKVTFSTITLNCCLRTNYS